MAREGLSMFTKCLVWAAQRIVISTKRKQKSERCVCEEHKEIDLGHVEFESSL